MFALMSSSYPNDSRVSWIRLVPSPEGPGCATMKSAVKAKAVGRAVGTRSVPSRTDADVAMERYAAGDEAAFALVYDAIAPRLLGYLLRRTRDPEDAADLLQQTMLHIHRGRGDFIPGAEVTPWAFAIARRLLIDSVRHRGPGPRGDSEGMESKPSEGPRADDLVHAGELAVRVQRALDELPAAQRVAFELVRQEGLSLADAARTLGTTVGGAKQRMHRAYEAIRAALADAESSLRRGTR
jgi:RNA polymerase sigma-70 factor (ECF subfamily)